MHALSSCHSSKQTTILAVTVVSKPQLLKLIACLEFTMRILLSVSRDGSEHGVNEGEILLVNPP